MSSYIGLEICLYNVIMYSFVLHVTTVSDRMHCVCYVKLFNFPFFFFPHPSGSWKTKSFKAYNFDALGVPPSRGHFHPLMKVRAEIRQIFLEMG